MTIHRNSTTAPAVFAPDKVRNTGSFAMKNDPKICKPYYVKIIGAAVVLGFTGTASNAQTPNGKKEPIISATPIPVVSMGNRLSHQIVASDAESYEATGLPPGLWINPKTGVISGLVLFEGTLNVKVIARNRTGFAATIVSIVATKSDKRDDVK